MATTTMAPPESPESTILTLTQQHREGQALQQYAYDPAVIDQAVMLGDMSKMPPEMRLDFYKAVCLSVGLNPLSQPFTVLKRQDNTTWLYANSSCTQQLAALHRVSFRDMEREHLTILGEPLYVVRVTAVLPDGRTVPSQAVVALTKKKRQEAGKWPNGDPKFRDVLDDDAEPVLIPLRGESLANALMRGETKALRRATLALVGLGWMQSDFEGRAVTFDLRTGALGEDPRLVPATRHLDAPAEQAKTTTDHISDLSGDVHDPLAAQLYMPQIEAIILANQGDLEQCYGWAERKFNKARTQFTADDWEGFLTAVREQAQQRAQSRTGAPRRHDQAADVSAEGGEEKTAQGPIQSATQPEPNLWPNEDLAD